MWGLDFGLRFGLSTPMETEDEDAQEFVFKVLEYIGTGITAATVELTGINRAYFFVYGELV